MRTTVAAALLALAACAGPRTLEDAGRELARETDEVVRLRLVDELVNSGDHRMVPLLIDGLDAAAAQSKMPDPDYTTDSVTPETRGPELWALIVVTGKDFKRDAAAWRAWWTAEGPKLAWSGARKRFLQR